MQRSEIITFIRTVPLFVELDQPQLEQLADATELRSFASGDIVVDQDHAANELFIIVEGELQAVVGDRHLVTEKELTRLYPGDYFGVVSFFTGAVNNSVVRALEPGRMLVLKREAIDGLFESSPAFARTICRSLAASVTQSLDRVPTVPMVRLDQFRNIAAANSILPKKIARTCQCLVVERDDHQAKVAMVDPHDARARSFLASVLSGKQLEFVAITDEDFERVAPRYLAESAKPIAEDEVAGTLNFINSQGERGAIDDAGSDLLPRALIAAIRDRASDIHIEPGLPTGRVRLRIDGRLLSFEENVPSNIIRQLISRVKVMSELNITNVRRPQDGRFVVVAGGQRVEMRAASIPCHGGEKVVLRLNAPDDHLSSLANLVVFESVQTFVEDILNQPSGLVLVTGPTGAGKTTTLYAALNHLNQLDYARNIVTIEDPIEYDLPYATQTQVNRDLDLSFAEILRAVLRQDPDVILVGEMRDAESAAIAVEAASTGHLVLSTLHTHTALETLVRLRNLHVKPYMLADALRGIISQKLMRRLAPGYTQTVPVDDPAVVQLKQLGVLEENWQGTLQRGRQDSDGPEGGELGRVAAFEVLTVTDAVRELIEVSAPQSEIAKRITDQTHLTFAEYCRMLLKDKFVAPERVVEIFPKTAHFEENGQS